MRPARGSRLRRRRAVALGAVLLLGWALLPRSPAALHLDQYFPDVQPNAIAHYLADFSNHALLHRHIESWAIESEWNNYSSWRYEVSYKCGACCAGRAAVTAHSAYDAGTPRHAAARRHAIRALDAHCTRLLPALPWPALCEETESEAAVVGERDGARLNERLRARCSPLATLLARCTDVEELAARSQLRLRALSAALSPLQ